MKFNVIDYRDRHAPQRFCESLHDTGFGVLAHHPLDQTQILQIYAEWLAFFGSQAKHQYPHDPASKAIPNET